MGRGSAIFSTNGPSTSAGFEYQHDSIVAGCESCVRGNALLLKLLVINRAGKHYHQPQMSFLSGPECSTGANPLAQFTKHVQDDKTLQHDRLRGSGSGPVHEGFRTQRDGSSQDHVCSCQTIGFERMTDGS